MSGNVSDFLNVPIRSKRALFTQKKLDRINFRSGKSSTKSTRCHHWSVVSRVVGHVHGHMILCHMVLTRWQTQ